MLTIVVEEDETKVAEVGGIEAVLGDEALDIVDDGLDEVGHCVP